MLDALATDEREAFAAVVPYLGGADPDPLLLEIARHREAFAGVFDPAALAAALGAEPGLTPERLLAETVLPDDEALIARAGRRSSRRAARATATAGDDARRGPRRGRRRHPARGASRTRC